MKWIIIIVVLLFAGWQAAVFVVNRSGESSALPVIDSSQSKVALPGSIKQLVNINSIKTPDGESDTIAKNNLGLPKEAIDTRNVQPQQIIDFAKTLIGVPYLYGSTDPAKGFDCSGFITYVFAHFNILVPRSSIDFTNVGWEVSVSEAKPADLILFTGTDSTELFVGHMGIVVSNTDSLRFIHSTSGKKYGVTITALNNYYKKRYVKTVRIFPDNN